MAAIILPTDIIDVQFVPMLIYGPPSSLKTSLCQTLEAPLTLDFDRGIHRSFNRKHAKRFDTWNEMLDAQNDGEFAPFQTIVVDTVNKLLQMMIPIVLSDSTSNGRNGALNPQGWGALGRMFLCWLAGIQSLDKDVVFVAHEAEKEGNGGKAFHYPKMVGNMAWDEIHNNCDLMGRIKYDGKKRVLDFSPSEEQVGKNAANWNAIPFPDLAKNPTFLGDLLTDAKLKIGKTAQASAAAASFVADWQAFLQSLPSRELLNAELPELALILSLAVKGQVKHLIGEYARGQGWVLDQATKSFLEPQKAGVA